MAPRTKASIEIDVKGLKAVNDLLNKLNSIDSKVNKINKVAGSSGGKSPLDDQHRLETQIVKLQTRSQKIRNQLLGLNQKDAKVQRLKARLTRAENKAGQARFTASKRELAIAEKELSLLQKQTIEVNNQAKGMNKLLQIRQGKFAGSGPGVFGPQPAPVKQTFAQRIGIKKGFDTESALISGAFPLLFGQGPIGALAGGLGGGIGGMFGGMGGFAGGIAATAVVQQIQGVIDGISKLGSALSPFTADVNAVIASLGVGGTALGKQLETYSQVASKTDALTEATRQMAILIGTDGVETIREFGESSTALKNDFDRAMLGMQAAVAKVALFIGNRFKIFDKEGTRGIKDRARQTFLRGDDKVTEEIKRKEKAIISAPFDADKGVTVDGQTFKNKKDALAFLKEQRLERQKQIDLENTGLVTQKNVENISKNRLKDLVEESRVLKDTLNGGEVKAEIEARVRALTKEVLGDQKELTADQITQIENQKTIIANEVTNNRQLKEQAKNAKAVKDAFKNISQSIGTDIKDGIKGLIKGTSTLGDLLNNVADKFLDVALNQALFGDVLGAGGKKEGGLLGFLGFARGGRPPVGKPSIVGEKGPELFVPRSSGTIVPNNKLGGGGSTSVVVNVDASGSDVQGDDAGGQELGSLVAVAVQGEIVRQQRPGGLLNR